MTGSRSGSTRRRSWSFLGHEMTFPELLTSALAALQREAPEVIREMAVTLGNLTVGMEVDREVVRLRAVEAAIRADRLVEGASLRIETSGGAVVQVVNGLVAVDEAVGEGTLQVWASPKDLEIVDRVLWSFLRGAIRSARVRDLWSRYRRAVTAREEC